MKKIVFIGLLLFPFMCFSQREKAFEINQKLGRGINFGNMFEAPSEGEWGALWQPEYPGMISGLGFNHVRIPIRWEPEARSSANPPYTINPDFLNRIKQVVDSALNNGLYAIINMHHHEALYEDPAGQKERFLTLWSQVSDFFKSYPDSLIFEVLNEPHNNLDAETWNTLFAEALDTIRVKNPERIVLMGVAEYGGLGGLPKLKIPDDPNIILTVHYYNPYHFTHQGAHWAEGSDAWLGTKWMDTETERDVMRQEFAPLKALSEQLQIPVHIGEFGAYEEADMESRVRWTTFVTRYVESLGWSWCYWEYCALFGIYDPNTKTYRQGLVDALLHNEIPDPFEYESTELYKSNFDSGTDGWKLYKQGSGVAGMQNSENQLTISINDGSTETWHIQLVKNNVELIAGKKYRVSFSVKASEQRTINAYMGMSVSPWSAYSDYNNITLSDTFANFAYLFDMEVSDAGARIVFDLGSSNADVVFSEIKLEELYVDPTFTPLISNELKIYPNPVKDVFRILGSDDYNMLDLYDLSGNKLFNFGLGGNKIFNIATLPEGVYIGKLHSNKSQKTFKILKQ